LAAANPTQPQRPDWVVAQDWNAYTPDEHAIWQALFERQTALLPGRACDQFLEGLRSLNIGAARIPDFAQLNESLRAQTGWQLVAVPGLLPDEVFFEHLANRRFPAARFIRSPDQLDYLQEPDVFHDVFGHVPMLTDPALADFMQAYGHGGLRAQRLGMLPHLARVYWYTVEFGLVQQAGARRIYGAGILSSHSESLYCLDDSAPKRLAFALDRVMCTRYRIDDFQQTYFVLNSLADLLDLSKVDFAPYYERACTVPDIDPGVRVLKNVDG
jgi:phenylalanine-4-hydroxylase